MRSRCETKTKASAFAAAIAGATIAALRAQAPFELGRIQPLGPVPAGVPSFRLARDGVLSRDGESGNGADALAAAIAAQPGEIVLAVDRQAPAAAVLAVVDRCA